MTIELVLATRTWKVKPYIKSLFQKEDETSLSLLWHDHLARLGCHALGVDRLIPRVDQPAGQPFDQTRSNVLSSVQRSRMLMISIAP